MFKGEVEFEFFIFFFGGRSKYRRELNMFMMDVEELGFGCKCFKGMNKWVDKRGV